MSSRFTRRFFSSNISVSQLNEVCEGVSLTPVKQIHGDGERYFPGAFRHVCRVGCSGTIQFCSQQQPPWSLSPETWLSLWFSPFPYPDIPLLYKSSWLYLWNTSLNPPFFFIPELALARPPSILAWINIRDSKPVSLVITVVSHYFVTSPNEYYIAPTLLVRHRAGLLEPSA